MAEDGYETYFAEKIWEMIPGIYRHEDGLAEDPGVLRALVEVLARQAAVVRRSHDRLWEDQFIELCDDWAVPYLGDLVGTRLVPALNLRGRRVDVAKTIYYRRRKGTLAVLEELIGDITGWEGTVVEQFRRLGRTPHRLDPAIERNPGRITGTPPGGIADLRRVRGGILAGGPFDEYHYTPDVRRHEAVEGRFAIPKIAFHLYRLPAYEVTGVTPARVESAEEGGARAYTFDPSGRDVPLFMPRSRPQDPATPTRPAQWDEWRPAREWELPAPLSCRLLNDPQAKPHLIPGALGVRTGPDDEDNLARGKMAAANLAAWTFRPVPGDEDDDVVAEVDPERGRLLLDSALAERPSVHYTYGFSGSIGAGAYARPHVEERRPDVSVPGGGGEVAMEDLDEQGVTRIEDSATYVVSGDITSVQNLVMQAANYQRPYWRINADWVFDGTGNGDASLELDGLWIGGEANEGGEPAVVLRGDYERVTLRHVTLDPGGPARAGDRAVDGPQITPVPLRIEGNIERLEVNASITGPIEVAGDGFVRQLNVSDSIMQGRDEDDDVVSARTGEAVLERVTVLGGTVVRRLWASETLIAGAVDIADIQTGCFRFGAARRVTRLPHPYESHRFEEDAAFFVSRRFGDPGYCQLSRTAPAGIRTGAENGSEIGAFSGLRNPIKQESLRAKVEEYLPFGRIPIYINET